MKSSRVQSFFAGMLVANSAPHVASAAAGREHMTPLAGRRSGAVANGVWAGLNLAAGVVLLRLAGKGKKEVRWDRDLVAFETGYLAFASWMALSERFFPMNSE